MHRIFIGITVLILSAAIHANSCEIDNLTNQTGYILKNSVFAQVDLKKYKMVHIDIGGLKAGDGSMDRIANNALSSNKKPLLDRFKSISSLGSYVFDSTIKKIKDYYHA